MSGTAVAVDANPAVRAARTGTELYAWEVSRRLPALAPDLDFTFYASRPPAEPGLEVTVLPMRRLWSQLRLAARLWRTRPDLLFVPSHAIPLAAPGRTLTVVHDLAFERFPQAYRPGQRAYLRFSTRFAERRCRLLLAVSHSTARDLAELHGVDPARVRVVHPGGGGAPSSTPGPAEVAAGLARMGVTGPYVLSVGRVEARKNQPAALAAVERVGGLGLVCAGAEADPAMAARLRASPACTVLGRVTDADLEVLYAGAEALCFPSLYEGFGFPVLEAMRRGLPVVTTRVSALPEVGGEAALYVDDPGDVEGLAARIEEAIADRPRLAATGPAQAGRFDWDRCAAGVVALMRELLELSPTT